MGSCMKGGWVDVGFCPTGGSAEVGVIGETIGKQVRMSTE